EIARLTGLSRSTVSEIVDSLLTTGLIEEIGAGKSSGGRRPIVLEFQDEARCILGVDLGATHVGVVLTDLRGNVLAWKERRHPVRSDPKGSRELVIALCDECLNESGKDKGSLLSIGVAVPSPVDPLNPKLLSEVVIPAWRGESGLEQLQQYYGVKVHVDNDANLGAVAENWWGAGQGIEDLVYIKVAHGIGAGYILNGDVYRGAAGVAGEMGHLPIDPNGSPCVCGLKGCLATLVGAPAVSERARELAGDYPDSCLKINSAPFSDLRVAVEQGDALATRLVDEITDYLAIAIAGWFNLMNPKLAILGGSMASLGEFVVGPLREKVRGNTLVSKAAVSIRIGELGPRAVAVGAATLALQAMFSDPQPVGSSEQPRT
ncbi:MAG: ROK family transcriptional regulator, partial [candidate division Zixibacteria bacterium]|nr:ROK family transcriptional regulator [candidate division Zixibacteria bacterium]